MDEDLIPIDDPELIAQLEQPQTVINKAAGGGGEKAQESERKAAFLASRLAGGLTNLGTISAEDQRPGLIEEGIRSIFGDTAANYITGEQRQRAEAAQVDIIDAALTLGTGAAYTREQLEGYRKAYFPQLGDSEATIADKRKRLDLLLQSAKIAAGGASSKIDQALKAAGYTGAASAGAGQSGDRDGPLDPAGTGDIGFANPDLGEGGPPLNPQQQAAYDAFWAANPEATAADLRAFGQSLGFNIDNVEAIIEARKAGAGVQPASTAVQGNIDISADRGSSDVGDNIKAFARGIPAVAGLDDELLAASDVLLNGEDWDEALTYNRAIRDYDEENNFWARLGGQFAAGALIPSGVAGAGRTAALAAARTGVGREAALATGARAAGVRGAQEGAAVGGVYGAGATDGSLGDRLVGGAGGAALAAVTGAGVSAAGSRLATRSAQRRPLTEGQEVMQAIDRLNAGPFVGSADEQLIPFAADVGGPVTRMSTAGASQTLGGVAPIRNAAQRALDRAQGLRDRVAQSFGIVSNPQSAGEAAARGARSFISRTSTRANALYNQAEGLAGQARVETPEALRILDEEIARLGETPGGAEGLARLQDLRTALDQPNTVRGLRNMRSALRDQFETAGLRNTNLERIANRVVDAASDDIVAGLQQQGLNSAARQYRIADRYWRNRLETIDEAIEPIIGNANNRKSGEQVVQALKASMSGNNRRFASFIGSLPPQEQGIVRASLVSRLGQAPKGQQDEAGEVFSLASFLTHWNDIGETAKRTLFGDEGRAALNELAVIARGTKQAQKFANTSNTGAAVTTSALGATALTGPGLVLAAKALAGSYAAGRLLASPRFARWVARMPRNPSNTQGRAYIGRLSRVANAEPAIANDVLDLQARLINAFETPARAAAQQEEDQ